jgi:hypothetical protein
VDLTKKEFDLLAYLMQNMTAGSGSQAFIVRFTTATLTDTTETYTFTNVPVGDYTVKGVRATTGTDGAVVNQNSLTTPAVTETASATVTADLQF